MADESIPKGGLNYEINVKGNFEEVIQRFENKLAELEARSKNLGKSITTSPAASGGEAASAADIQKSRTATEMVEKRIAALKERQTTAASEQVKYERYLTSLVEERQTLGVKLLQTQATATTQSNLMAKAELANASAAEKRAKAEAQIALAREKLVASGVKATPENMQTATNLPMATLNKYDPDIARQNQAIADQNRQIAEQGKMRKTQEAQQERMNKQVAADAKTRQSVVAYSEQHAVSEARAAQALGLSAAQAKRLGYELSSAQKFAENFFFTFRRLVGILAIFTLARKFAQFLGEGVTEMTRFNGVLEQTKLSFASLLASVGDINDINGKNLTGIEKINAAMTLSDQMMKSMRVQSLTTVATFEDLSKAVTAGVAPGIRAGITDMKVLTDTIVLVTKAASAMGVSGSQFAEEIRAAFTGIGSLRNTRLFQGVLDPGQIKQAIEAGNIVQYLTSKLQPFNDASEKVAKSWMGLKSNMVDAIQAVLSTGGEAYFESLKNAMSDFIATVIDLDKVKQGMDITDVMNKDVLGGVQEISSALADLINEFKEISKTSDNFAALRVVLINVGETLRLVGSLVLPIVAGFVKVVTVVQQVFALVYKIGRAILSILPDWVGDGFREILVLIGAIIALVFTWNTLAKITTVWLALEKVLIEGIVVILRVMALTQVAINAGIAAWNKGLSITAVLMAVIKALSSVWGIVILAIVAIIGVVLSKTGLISKGFDKLNSILGITKNKVDDTASALKDVIFGIGSASEETKKLENSFQGVTDKIGEMANKLKAMMLVSGIRGEAKQIFDTYAESYEQAANRVRKNLIEQEALDKRIAEAKGKYTDAEILKAKEYASMTETQRKNALQSGGNKWAVADPADVPRSSISKIFDYKSILENQAKIKADENERQRLEEDIAQALQQQNDILYTQTAISKLGLDQEVDGTSEINRNYDVRKALAEEMFRLNNTSVQQLAAQTIEVARQNALIKRTKELNAESAALETKTISDFQQQNNINESSNRDAIALISRMKMSEQDLQVFRDAANGKQIKEQDALNAVKNLENQILSITDTKQQEIAKSLVSHVKNMVTLNTLTQAHNGHEKERDALLKAQEARLRTQIADLQKMKDLIVASNQGMAESLAAGFKYGAEEFVQSTQPMAVMFADAFKNALENAVQETANALTDLLDPRKEAPTVGEVVGNILLGFANQVFAAILQQFVASLLSNTMGMVTAQAANTAAITALTAEIAALTIALGGDTAAATANAAATTGNTAATTANSGGLFSMLGGLLSNTAALVWNGITLIAQGAMWVAQLIANVAALAFNSMCLLINAAIPGKTGGLAGSKGFGRGVVGLQHGGSVFEYAHGYASGGDIRRHPRPAFISPMDTVPAWLQPGEFVIPRRRVQEFGVGFFEKIRTGFLDPAGAEKILNQRVKNYHGVLGMADGGSVPNITRTSISQKGDGGVTVLPVLVADNNSMDQMVAGGRKIFNRRVNETTGRASKNASDVWR